MTYENLTLPNIAVIGKMGVGKSTASKFLQEEFGYTPISFAAPLRSIAVELWGEKVRNSRRHLQGLGVAVREIEPDTWADILVATLEEENAVDPTQRWVVDDCRFPNEVWRLAEAGFIFVRVVASRTARVARLKANGKLTDEAQLEHPSETQLDDFKTKYILGNDTGGLPLSTQIIEVLNKERR